MSSDFEYYRWLHAINGTLTIKYMNWHVPSNLVYSDSGQIYCVGKSQLSCYIIRSTTSRRTYVGYTDNMTRRLRKHNGEIKGGAKATRTGRPWELVAYVQGFLTDGEALSFEWYMHHPKWIYKSKLNTSGRRYRVGSGIEHRLAHLYTMLECGIWRRKYPVKDNRMTIFWHIDRRFELSVRQYHHRSVAHSFSVSNTGI